jgi:transcription-repair coupling factor (superfamily II helicase)
VNLGKDKTVAEIISRLKTAKPEDGPVEVEGTWGSFARLLTAYISEKLGRPILYICPHIDDADRAGDDLHTWLGHLGQDSICKSRAGCPCHTEGIEALSAWEGEEDLADATDEIRAERLRVTLKLVSGANKFIIPASIQALCQPIPKPEALEASCLRLQVERKVSPEEVVGWLVENGFERVERVDLPGQFARRGGIVDIYAPLISEKTRLPRRCAPRNDRRADDGRGTQSSPLSAGTSNGAEAVRVEFFGDTVESIREINLDTQRSSQQIKSINIVSAVCGTAVEERELFVNILPADTIIILEEPGDIEEVAKVFLERAEDAVYSWGEIYAGLERFTQLRIYRFAPSAPGDFLRVDIKSVQRFQHKAASLWAGHKTALEELVKEAKQGKKVLLYCEASAEIKRVTEIIKEINKKVPANFKLLQGFIHQGFVVNSLKTCNSNLVFCIFLTLITRTYTLNAVRSTPGYIH